MLVEDAWNVTGDPNGTVPIVTDVGGLHDTVIDVDASPRSGTDLVATGETRKNQWLRLSGTLQLGRRFYLLGELESATGDDLEGERLFLQLGYRL